MWWSLVTIDRGDLILGRARYTERDFMTTGWIDDLTEPGVVFALVVVG
jgi:hypothetical protein